MEGGKGWGGAGTPPQGVTAMRANYNRHLRSAHTATLQAAMNTCRTSCAWISVDQHKVTWW